MKIVSYDEFLEYLLDVGVSPVPEEMEDFFGFPVNLEGVKRWFSCAGNHLEEVEGSLSYYERDTQIPGPPDLWRTAAEHQPE